MKKFLSLLMLLPLPALAVDCHISEYSYISQMADGQRAQAILEPAIATQKITFTTTSTQSSAFASGVRVIRVVCTAKTHFEIGANPTASNADPFLAANTPEYFGVSSSTLLIAFQDGN